MWLKLFVLFFMAFLCCAENKKPNIIVIIADDMGFNDVSFHGSDEIPTPNIDALAYNGVILNSHYTQALCTPSRAAFLTGKYPIHLGMQHLVILEPEPWGLPLNETILPQYLKQNGYSTHAIGKWHLGFCKKEYTPTYRGFDSHFGYWQGLQDYYSHMVHSTYGPEYGYDMRRNMSVDWDSKGKYSTTLFTEEAVKLIHDHNTDNPMFMYMAHLAPHSGNDDDPLQAPDEEIAKFAHIEDPERRVYAAMVSMLDQSVGSVVTALREKHMLENTIIVFFSDNGAQPELVHSNHGSNYPLKGTKNSPWEGAMRNVAAIWSPLIKNPQRVSNNVMHISDWLPTFYSAAGLNASELPKNIDGQDQWKSISEGTPSPRTELLYNIDDVWNYFAIRQGDWKYLFGSVTKGALDHWYGNSGKSDIYSYDEESVLKSPAGSAFTGLITFQQIKEKNSQHKTSNFSIDILDVEKVKQLRDEATVKCKKLTPEEELEVHKCDNVQSPCLFNLKEDPCERVNLASQRPMIVHNLEQALMRYKRTAYPLINVPADPNADPAKHNHTWTNWLDKDNVSKTKISYNTLTPLATGLVSGASVAVVVVVLILLTIACRTPKDRSQHGSNMSFKTSGSDNVVEMAVKSRGSLFEDIEKQVRTCLKEDFRTVE